MIQINKKKKNLKKFELNKRIIFLTRLIGHINYVNAILKILRTLMVIYRCNHDLHQSKLVLDQSIENLQQPNALFEVHSQNKVMKNQQHHRPDKNKLILKINTIINKKIFKKRKITCQLPELTSKTVR